MNIDNENVSHFSTGAHFFQDVKHFSLTDVSTKWRALQFVCGGPCEGHILQTQELLAHRLQQPHVDMFPVCGRNGISALVIVVCLESSNIMQNRRVVVLPHSPHPANCASLPACLSSCILCLFVVALFVWHYKFYFILSNSLKLKHL